MFGKASPRPPRVSSAFLNPKLGQRTNGAAGGLRYPQAPMYQRTCAIPAHWFRDPLNYGREIEQAVEAALG
jgi:hypothetical protein